MVYRPWTGSTASGGFGRGTDSVGPDAVLVISVRRPSLKTSFGRSKGDTGEIGNGTETETGPGVPVINTGRSPSMAIYAEDEPVVKTMRRGLADADIGTVEGVLVDPIILRTLLSATFPRLSNGLVSGRPGGRGTGATEDGGEVVLGATLMLDTLEILKPTVTMAIEPDTE